MLSVCRVKPTSVDNVVTELTVPVPALPMSTEASQTTSAGRIVLIGEPIPLAGRLVSPVHREATVLTNSSLAQRSRGALSLGTSRAMSPGAHLVHLSPLQLPNRPFTANLPSSPQPTPGSSSRYAFSAATAASASAAASASPATARTSTQFNPIGWVTNALRRSDMEAGPAGVAAAGVGTTSSPEGASAGPADRRFDNVSVV
jgi:hypothetical protein